MTTIDQSCYKLNRKAISRCPFLQEVQFHRQVSSTNQIALSLAADSQTSTPALVVAECQTAGRGRGNHHWWSPPGALLFSLVLEPDQIGLPTGQRPALPLAMAVAICDVIGQRIPRMTLGIKWPNDVYVANHKLGGILVKIPRPLPSGVQRAVIGVGINVNNSWRMAPTDLQSVGTSLIDETTRSHNLTELLLSLLEKLPPRLAQLATSDRQLSERWHALCILRNRLIEVQRGQTTLRGRCSGIGPDGTLMLDTPAGTKLLSQGNVTDRGSAAAFENTPSS